jgi:hypothetical protein
LRDVRAIAEPGDPVGKASLVDMPPKVGLERSFPDEKEMQLGRDPERLAKDSEEEELVFLRFASADVADDRPAGGDA